MAYFRCGGGGMPAGLQSDMDAVLNKKFGTSTTYPASGWPDNVNLMGPLPEKTQASASVCAFDDGADDVPSSSVKVTIPATLLGVSSVTETQTGKNIYDKNAGVYDDSYFNQDGTTTHYADVAVSWIRVNPNTKYTFSLGATPSRTTFLRWINCDKDKNFISRPVASYGSQNFPYTVTTPNDCQWVQLAINEYPAAQISSNDWVIQIEENSSATAYEPYQTPTTYTASLGRTIYGGQVDIVNGTGTDENGNDFTFTGQEINTRLGYNAFWSDEGDTEVTYRADINLALGGQ